MLKAVRIRNFKSFKDSGLVDLRPLTILVGPNSSGKSSVLQSLLMIRQTVDSRDVRNPLVIEGEYVSLGSYRDLVHRHDLLKTVEIELHLPTSRALIWGLHGTAEARRGRAVESVVLRAVFSYNRRKAQIHPLTVEYETIPSSVATRVKRAKGRNQYTIESVDEDGVVERGTYRGLRKFYLASFLGVKSAATLARLVRRGRIFPYAGEAFESLVETTFRNLFYLGPLRETPKRFYAATGETPQDVGIKGEAAADVLRLARVDARLKTVVAKVRQWMKTFEIATDVRMAMIRETFFRLNLKDPYLDIDMNVADVGFGASQVLPLMVEGFYAPRGATLIVEQPEIHLHPRAQGHLGDLLIDIVEQGRQLLVETHSEHLLSRLRRRIAEGKIERDKVAIYYCEPTSEGTVIKEIKLSKLGQFEEEGLPAGFLEEGYRESFEHAKAMGSGARD